MTTINRRAALLGTVTLPAAMAPLGALAATGEISQFDAEPDPFVAAFCRYVDAEEDRAIFIDRRRAGRPRSSTLHRS